MAAATALRLRSHTPRLVGGNGWNRPIWVSVGSSAIPNEHMEGQTRERRRGHDMRCLPFGEESACATLRSPGSLLLVGTRMLRSSTQLACFS